MPRTIDHQRRIRIAEQALEVIKARGLTRASMTDIASELGMKRSTLYWYFGGVAEILESLLEHVLAREVDFIRGRVEGIDDPLRALEAYLEASCEFYEHYQDVFLLVFQFAASRDGELSPVFDRIRANFALFRAEAVRRIEHARQQGRVGPCDPAVLVDLVEAVSDGLLVNRMIKGMSVAPVRELFARLVLEPLRGRDATHGRQP